jgi:hypothetical protein
MDNIVNKIYKLVTEAKRKDIDPKLKAWIEQRYGPWDDRDFISDDGDTYFKTDADYESEGGGISHTVVKLPSFSELIKQLKATKDAANNLVKGESVRDDEVLRSIADELRLEFNKFRTHIRKEYPAFYAQLKGQLTEEEIDEMSTSGAAGAFLTPYAFRKPKKKQKPIPEAKVNETMDGGQVFDYFANKGYVVKERRPDGYPKKEGVIGYQVTDRPDSGRRGDNPQTVIFQYNPSTDQFTISQMNGYKIDQKDAIKAGMRQQSQSWAAGIDSYITDGNYNPVDISVEGLKDIVDHVMGGLSREAKAQRDFYADRGPTSGTIDEGVGASLGPGPKAGKDGVEKNTYTSEFGYKLVPKNKAGNYVQKGSKLDVKQLFEDQKEYQDKRIAAFDVIEQEMNDIYKMLSNAKNETSDYYNDNPSSYSVVKPTDLVLDYIKDIKDLLKGE